MNTNDIVPGLGLDVLSLDDLDALEDEILIEKERRKVKRALSISLEHVSNAIVTSLPSALERKDSKFDVFGRWQKVSTPTGEVTHIYIKEDIYLDGSRIDECEYKITVEGKML